MILTPRPYQTKDMEACRRALVKHKRIVRQLPTGGGKGFEISYIAMNAYAKGKRVLILTHRQEILTQISDKLVDVGIPHGIIWSKVRPRPQEFIQVAMDKSIIRRLDKYPHFDLVLLDECFPAGTLVGGIPIETIRIGDMVASFNEQTRQVEMKTVTYVFKSKPKYHLVRVVLDNGKAITCTPKHPFYRGGEWVPAESLKPGDSLLEIIDGSLCDLQKNIREQAQDRQDLRERVRECSAQVARENRASSVHDLRENGGPFWTRWLGSVSQRSGILLRRAQTRICQQTQFRKDGGNESEVCKRTHDQPKPNDARGCAGESFANLEKDRTQAEGSWWKWACSCAAKATSRSAWMGDGVPGTYSGYQVVLSENRHSECRDEDRDRSGRREPLFPEGSRDGRREASILGVARVDRIEVLEQGGNGEFGRLCPDGYVYNLEVADNHTYFADGILVHNCHHSLCKSWLDIIAAYPDAHFIGFTATPIRADGKGLNDIFQYMVLGPTIRELTEQGYLKPAVVYAPPGINIEGVPTRYGDYVTKKLEVATNKPTITGCAIEHWQKYAPGLPTLVSCVSVQHAKDVSDQFVASGIPSTFVHGNMEDRERKRILYEDLPSGRIKAVMFCDLISEGVDVPVVACVSMLRKSMSLGLVLQIIGRSLRPCEGYDEAIILDHVGNVAIHGMPDEDREWTLEGIPKRPKGKATPRSEAIRTCPTCYNVHEWAGACPKCGHEYALGREIEQVDGELQRIDTAAIAARKRELLPLVHVASSLSELSELEAALDYKPGWAVHQARGKGLDVNDDEIYAYLKGAAARRGYKRGWVFRKMQELGGERTEQERQWV